MRKPLVAGNWKMNLLSTQGVSLVEHLKTEVASCGGVEVVVCPPFTLIPAVAQAARDSAIAVGGQNIYPQASGAFTGEIAPGMLLDAGATWTIIGHSERRQLFGEADGLLNEKLHFALRSGLKVMFCIGETLEEREGGAMDEVLRRQVTLGLADLSAEDFSRIAVAYEPVWAIGTGVTATPDQAEEAHAFVRGLVSGQFGAEVANGLRIQYGGSVKAENAAELIANANVDGFLVGGASLEAEGFAAIVRAAA